ncbi:ABC transporter transmembrane domain-containing protein [Marinobacterium rhizophilum]|uniref:ABC transporter ATP-binding protein n=1 Tax=Marinobacterium rhizophilum TaxID=420402 RepID=A0ABY5HQ57_9GAMM|nr:ABC transporter transmembrane domain-containing protein [Marinobacterium rhizophilum]UTW13339.1 ABC transporter ATP-binding protein [Marinobacterium rhizophilum]
MDKSIVRFILRYSTPQQIRLLLMTFCSFPLLYVSLELPKIIINDAIGDSTSIKQIFDITFTPMHYLLALCGLLLTMILINGMVKMYINTYKGIVGERLVRRLRYQLVERILRFQPRRFQMISQGELISTVTAETEPLAGFIGDSIALPAFQGGTMLTILLFMFMQDPILGIASIALIPLQIVIIPRLQRKINLLKKERVKTVRHFSQRIGESVDGMMEIRLHGTRPYHLAEFSKILGELFRIRLDIYKKKFFMKFLNNLINQLTPLMFYSIGGVLAIRGDLTIGALVAAVAAHKDLAAPWKELLDYYQQYQDSHIKYEQILEQFQSQELMPTVPASDTSPTQLDNHICLDKVAVGSELGNRLVRNINLELPAGGSMAIRCKDPSRLRALARTLIRINPPLSGHLLFGNDDLQTLPSDLLARELTYVGPDAFLFSGNMLQNINYSMRLKPPMEPPEALDSQRLWEIREAEASGNSTDRFDGIWTDFALAHAENWEDMRHWLYQGLKVVGADELIYNVGLNEKYNPVDRPQELSDGLLRVRRQLLQRVPAAGLDHLVERLDPQRYNCGLSVAENLGFGVPCPPISTPASMAAHPQMSALLEQFDLNRAALNCGRRMAERLSELALEAGPLDPLPDNFGEFDTPEFRRQVSELERRDPARSSEDARLLLELFLRIVPLRHGDDLLDDSLTAQLLATRQVVMARTDCPLCSSFDHFSEDRISAGLTVRENVLFGKVIGTDQAQLRQLQQLIDAAMQDEDAESMVMVLAGFTQVGIRGGSLPLIARQRIQLLRAIVKHPKVLVMHEALTAMSLEERATVLRRIRTRLPELTLIYLDQEIPPGDLFDSQYQIIADELQSLDIDTLPSLASSNL